VTKVPADLKYTREHEWVRVEGDLATVGITDYAQKELGDIVFVEVPEVGTKLAQFGPMGVVESVKAASDIFSPVSGSVEDANKALANTPDIINKDPYGDGWLAKIRLAKASEIETLLDAAAYTELIAKEKEGK
jgi:glycine cleavage system H protein